MYSTEFLNHKSDDDIAEHFVDVFYHLNNRMNRIHVDWFEDYRIYDVRKLFDEFRDELPGIETTYSDIVVNIKRRLYIPRRDIEFEIRKRRVNDSHKSATAFVRRTMIYLIIYIIIFYIGR